MKPSTYMALAIGAVAVMALLLTLQYPPEASLFPIIIGLPLLLGATGQALMEIRGRAREEAVAAKAGGIRPHVITIAWVMVLPLIIYIFGFLVGAALYIFAYLRLQRQGWGIAAALAAGVTAVYYFGFILTLKVSLYKGLIYSLIY